MDETHKIRLLDEFRQYLDTVETAEAQDDAETDLFSLFSELAALRTEVKTEARQFGAALEAFRESQNLLRDSQAGLDRALESQRSELAGVRRAVLRPLLLEWLDVHDRLSAGAAALDGFRPVKGWFRVKSRKEDLAFIESIRQGQTMLLRRLDEALARHRVRPLQALGQPADPHTMTVVELDRRPELANGVVTAELRKGFLWDDEVLRLAEVKANKL